MASACIINVQTCNLLFSRICMLTGKAKNASILNEARLLQSFRERVRELSSSFIEVIMSCHVIHI